jgi:hypothetical protein
MPSHFAAPPAAQLQILGQASMVPSWSADLLLVVSILQRLGPGYYLYDCCFLRPRCHCSSLHFHFPAKVWNPSTLEKKEQKPCSYPSFGRRAPPSLPDLHHHLTSHVSLSVSLRPSPFREASFLKSDLEAQRSSPRNETLHSSLVVSKIVPRRWVKDSCVELVAFCIFSRQCTTLTTISTDALDQGGKDRSEFQTVIHPHGQSALDRSIDDAISGICPLVPRLLTHTQQNFNQTGRKLLINGRPKTKVCKISKKTQTPVTVYYSWWLELHFSVSFRRMMIIFV